MGKKRNRSDLLAIWNLSNRKEHEAENRDVQEQGEDTVSRELGNDTELSVQVAEGTEHIGFFLPL